VFIVKFSILRGSILDVAIVFSIVLDNPDEFFAVASILYSVFGVNPVKVPKISEPSVLLKESLLHSSLKDVILAPPV
jgi:hypothetical protein